MTQKSFAIIVALGMFMLSCSSSEAAQKPRFLVTTDIGGDPDDTQSMVRLLVSSSEMELEGLIASASGTPGELDTFVARPDLIMDLIEAYGSVYENLSLHDPDYPHPDQLRKVVKKGNPMRGLDYIGEGMDTEGSQWIVECILREDKRPLNICVWGGQTDLAQALFSMKNRMPADAFSRATENIRIYNINDQDKIHQWFSEEFPELFHILARAPQGRDKREGVYRGIYLGGDESLTSREWVYKHVKEGHGPLGALYPDRTWTAPNPHGCMKEGDTPSWFYFLENGLQDPAHPAFGSWGGRFQADQKLYFVDDKDQVDSTYSARATVWRWRDAFQRDFEARMDWCVMSPGQANHHPLAVLNGDNSKKILEMRVNKGESVRLDASGSWDPDGDDLKYAWWIYPEPSGIRTAPEIENRNGRLIYLDERILSLSPELHIILELRDQGSPALTSYRRIILQSGK